MSSSTSHISNYSYRRNVFQPEEQTISVEKGGFRDFCKLENLLALPAARVFNGHEVRKLECKRCGKCCYADMIAYATKEDINRWRHEKRQDILDRLENEERIWAGDRIIYRDGSGNLERCAFLKIEKGLATCTIHQTRPRVCRDFEAGSSLLCPLNKG